ncbi:hypothetical protein BG004_002216 [Podila humilis]|nr:hypothetical protein BG004_002216 [Podila humilis]
MRNLHFVLVALLALIAMASAGSHTTTTKAVVEDYKYSSQKKTTTTTARTTKKHATTAKPRKITTTRHSTTTTTKHISSPSPKPVKLGKTGVVLSQTDFCIWLPPAFGGDIAANEDRAVTFCTKPNMAGARNAGVLPSGFIKSAHFVTNTQRGYVQMTGRMDRSKYGLSGKDGGGQYDMRAPVGAICNGYKAFVQLTEPDAQIYCIRCCMNKADCPVNKSTYGCEKVLGGDYS